ncbi:hypothetical protein TSUD_394580 [Trifolium subterraneum]|uniref:Transposase (putative) gypsy type domain-containing protein n=1 Tax=Trifolium subterraneum TaxID=3900 RepID=A0A2Z6MZ17_TRISU|nr:hypothetical protein TSUD_394580 [Trifolium subterraneum]
MAEEQAQASTSNIEDDEMAWVADETRTTISKFSLTGGGIFKTVQHPPLDDWKACVPNTNRRICSKYQWSSFPMYQIAFKHMGYRLPFGDFEVTVFRHLHLTPSQLHPNSLAFIRAFEMTTVYLGFLPTIPLFFHAFHLQRSRPKGDAEKKFSWVSLKQSVKLFEIFLEFVRGFKDSYIFVKPLNFVAWQSVIYRGPAKDATGAPLVGPDGRPIMDDYSRFPLSWRKGHYLRPASDFVYSTEELTVEELSNYEQLKVFVSGFPRKYYEDEDGNPVLDEIGVPFSSSTTAPSPTPVVDLENVNERATDNPRPSKVPHVDEAYALAGGRIPYTLPKFVIPPAIGSPELVKNPRANGDLELSQLPRVQILGGEGCIQGGRCSYSVKDLITEKNALEGKVKELEGRPCSSIPAVDPEELVVDPQGEYKGFTRAALVSRIFELEAQQLEIAKSSFDNAVAQLMVLNPGVDLATDGASELKEFEDGVIISPSPDED